MASLALEKDGVVVGQAIFLEADPAKTEWSVGRSLECDINVPHASVSRRHARIFSDGDGGFYLADLSSTHGTFVAGSRISESVRLFDGLRIAFGTSGFELVPANMMAAVMKAAQAAHLKWNGATWTAPRALHGPCRHHRGYRQ